MDIAIGDKVKLASGVTGIVAGVRVEEEHTFVKVGHPHGPWHDAEEAIVEPAVVDEPVEEETTKPTAAAPARSAPAPAPAPAPSASAK